MNNKIRINFKLIVIALLIIILFFPNDLWGHIVKASSESDISCKVYFEKNGWYDVESKELNNNTDKKIEAIKLDISGESKSLWYSVYIKDEGWTSYVNGGTALGKISRGKPIEQIRIKLSGHLKDMYDVEYRVNFGNSLWTRWFSNGEAAYNKVNKTLYNVEVRLVNK